MTDNPINKSVEIPKRGEIVKVRLQGETPWTIVVEERHSSWMGCILNKLFREYSEHEQAQALGKMWGKGFVKLPELHKFSQYDVVEFAWPVIEAEYNMWEPLND